MARKKPTSIAMKSYFEDLGASVVLVSVVDETPADDVVDAGVTGGAMPAEAGAAPGVEAVEAADVDGEFRPGFAEDGPADVGEFGAGPGDTEVEGTFGTDVEGEADVGIEAPGMEDGTTPAPAVATPLGAEAAPGEPVLVTGMLAVEAVAGLIGALEFVFETSC